MTVTLGALELGPLDVSLLARPVADALASLPEVAAHAHTVAIDPDLADTAALASEHGIPPEVSANCVVVLGRRGGPGTRFVPRRSLPASRWRSSGPGCSLRSPTLS